MLSTSSRSFRHRRGRLRRGNLTVEMIMVVVVLAIVTIGIVQFGAFFANAQMVALAARDGALEASQTCDLPECDGEVPQNILRAIQHQLASSGIDWCHVRLEHNVTPQEDIVALTSASGPSMTVPAKTNLGGPPALGTQYVRLTVCVPLSDVFPKRLSYFGEQLFPKDRTYEHTAIFRYERSQQGCQCERNGEAEGEHHGKQRRHDRET